MKSKRLLYISLIIFGLIIFMYICSLLPKSPQLLGGPRPIPSLKFDEAQLKEQLERLKVTLRFRTISTSKSLSAGITERNTAFQELHQFLREHYPLVFRELDIHELGDALVLCWHGSDSSLKPYLFAAHQDVVSALDEKNWSHKPFLADEDEGFIWARGSLDMKSALVANLEALEFLLEHHVVPQRTLYFAFGADEETGGNEGAAKIATEFRNAHIQFQTVFDEGLTILTNVMPGLQQPVALIGVAQKGYLTVKLRAKDIGGHSSMPHTHSAIESIARAIVNIHDDPFPFRMNAAVDAMLTTIAPFESPILRILFTNLWATHPLVLFQFSRSPQTAALVHSTVATTIIQGGVQDNVLPTIAEATVNMRLAPGDSIAYALQRLKVTISDSEIEVLEEKGSAVEASGISTTESQSYQDIQQSVVDQFPNTIVAPSLMIGSTDSRHYQDIATNVYRFLPLVLAKEELGQIHGINERIGKENYRALLAYYLELIQLSSLSH